MPRRPRPIPIPAWNEDMFDVEPPVNQSTPPASSPDSLASPKSSPAQPEAPNTSAPAAAKPTTYFETAPWYEVNPGGVRLLQDERVRVCPKCHKPAVMRVHEGGPGHPGPWTQFAHSVLARSQDLLVASYHCVVEGRVE